MNEKEFEPYITKTFENRAFYRRMEQTEEPIKTMIEKQFDTFKQCEDFLGNPYNSKYSLGWVSRSNNVITRIEMFERNYYGFMYQVVYKGLFFNFECTVDGEVNRPYFVYNGFKSSSGWLEMGCFENMDSFYNYAIKVIRDDKRQIMNHYNKLIKDAKVDYRERLVKINALLKGESI